LVSSNSKHAVATLDFGAFGECTSPELDSQYRPTGNNCQAKIAGEKKKVAKCSSDCD
jgi:hypothetical protein